MFKYDFIEQFVCARDDYGRFSDCLGGSIGVNHSAALQYDLHFPTLNAVSSPPIHSLHLPAFPHSNLCDSIYAILVVTLEEAFSILLFKSSKAINFTLPKRQVTCPALLSLKKRGFGI